MMTLRLPIHLMTPIDLYYQYCSLYVIGKGAINWPLENTYCLFLITILYLINLLRHSHCITFWWAFCHATTGPPQLTPPQLVPHYRLDRRSLKKAYKARYKVPHCRPSFPFHCAGLRGGLIITRVIQDTLIEQSPNIYSCIGTFSLLIKDEMHAILCRGSTIASYSVFTPNVYSS